MSTDFTTNNNPRYLYLAALHQQFPDWVARQPTPTSSEFAKQASTSFADPKRRLLPINTKVAAFHSAIDLFAHMSDYDAKVFERVKSACDFYGIGTDIAPYVNLFANEHEKSASEVVRPEGKFAINTEINGKEFKLLPLNDADDIRNSAHDLSKMASERRIHFLTLLPAARNIVKAAADIGGVKLPERIEMLGLERFTNFDKSAELIAGREKHAHLRDPADQLIFKRHYDEAVKEMSDGTITPDDCMQKIAAIDEQAGIAPDFRAWSKVPLPSDIVFCGTLVSEAEKAASMHVYLRNVLVPLDAIKSINPMEVGFKLTKEAGDSLNRVLDTDDAKDISMVVSSWSDEDQKTLLRLAASQ